MSPRPRIYTRTGDAGSSALSGGARFSKADSVFSAMGDIDELSAHLGLLKARLRAASKPGSAAAVAALDAIQRQLFAVSADLCGAAPYTNVQCAAAVKALESGIDALEASDSRPAGFVIPGADVPSSEAHVARTVCRRAERSLVAHAPSSAALPFLNRLSDYLFVLAVSLSR